jgi:hypothetical protein
LGELMVLIQGAFLFLRGKWKYQVSQLAHLLSGALHFVCECAVSNISFNPDALRAPVNSSVRLYEQRL